MVGTLGIEETSSQWCDYVIEEVVIGLGRSSFGGEVGCYFDEGYGSCGFDGRGADSLLECHVANKMRYALPKSKCSHCHWHLGFVCC